MLEHFHSLGTELLKKMFLQVKLELNESSSIFCLYQRAGQLCSLVSWGMKLADFGA